MKGHYEEWMQKLILAVKEAAENSPQVQAWLMRFQEEGFSIFLLLDTTIGLRKNGIKMPFYRQKQLIKREDPKPVTFEMNAEDVNFLKSIGIDPLKEPKRKKD